MLSKQLESEPNTTELHTEQRMQSKLYKDSIKYSDKDLLTLQDSTEVH